MLIEKIKVSTVDKQELIKFLNIPLKENEELSVDRFAVYENEFAIDIDACFWPIEKEHFNNVIQDTVPIYCRVKKHHDDKSFSIKMTPDFVKRISLKDYLTMATEVRLVDFIRYNYNPRIQANQKLLMKHIKVSLAEAAGI